jgi:hypothetical protein
MAGHLLGGAVIKSGVPFHRVSFETEWKYFKYFLLAEEVRHLFDTLKEKRDVVDFRIIFHDVSRF